MFKWDVPFDPRLNDLLVFFDPAVLAAYREAPDKYELRTDNFEGDVKVTTAYYERLGEEERDAAYISIAFGYRTLADGDIRLACLVHDLVEKSPAHLDKWKAHLVPTQAEWLAFDQDTRFSLWIRRYIKGDWNVENGPGAQLLDEIRLINGLALEATALRLFEVDDPRITYPLAQNTHRYQDSHRELYGILIDGLNKLCLTALAGAIGRPLKIDNLKTLTALEMLLPTLKADGRFSGALATVSEQRRLAAHKVRPMAQPVRAFEMFTGDLEACVAAVSLLKEILQQELGMDATKSKVRQDALEHLPAIANRGLPGNCSIHQACMMRGKTVEKVEVGSRRDYPTAHRSEIIHISFTDGSIISLDTWSNASNVSHATNGAFSPQDVNVDFRVHWVPPRPVGRPQ